MSDGRPYALELNLFCVLPRKWDRQDRVSSLEVEKAGLQGVVTPLTNQVRPDAGSIRKH